MYSHGRDGGPSVGGGTIIAFLVILTSTFAAFAAADAGVFDRKPPATLKLLLALEETEIVETPARLDLSQTASTGRASQSAGPSCNIEACSKAFRSFRGSDCTFQPFAGPRRLCMR